MTKITPVLYNIRSLHNVGSIMRTADGMGMNRIVTIGYTPHLPQENDRRLPHVIKRAQSQIAKTALGAETVLKNEHYGTLEQFISAKTSAPLVALEQSEGGVNIDQFSPPDEIYLMLGEERYGIPQDSLNKCDSIIEIPMQGQKNSFNVSVAFAIAAVKLQS